MDGRWAACRGEREPVNVMDEWAILQKSKNGGISHLLSQPHNKESDRSTSYSPKKTEQFKE
jgi:hypothetical protein